MNSSTVEKDVDYTCWCKEILVSNKENGEFHRRILLRIVDAYFPYIVGYVGKNNQKHFENDYGITKVESYRFAKRCPNTLYGDE